LEETICAPATPPITSPIAIIRISGPRSNKVIKLIFRYSKIIKPGYSLYGSIVENNIIIDDVILIYYKSPNSFTGEDMVEIFCHGNPIIVRKIIQLLNRYDIRMAEPGEFCKRSFLNGKIDLTEAEAINHIITARSDWEIDASIKQMHGSLKKNIYKIRDYLIQLKADIECGIDFGYEDIEFISNSEALCRLREIKSLLSDLLRRCSIGKQMTHGIDIPIVGKPNVGKSSILNLILNSDRAIVSDTPGTTRDLINEVIQFAGIRVNLIDTAGIDRPKCEIEKKGMDLSHKKIETASIILMVIDVTSTINESDRAILKKIADKPMIILANKFDLYSGKEIEINESLHGHEVIPFSAFTGEGLKELEWKIEKIISNEYVDYENSFISELRVVNLLEASFESINKTEMLLLERAPDEIIAIELQIFIDNISEITGEISPDEVLNSIFSRFCIGK